MFIAFFKRLVGQDADATETQRKFETGLDAMTSRKQGLELAGATIEAIIRDVDRKKEEISLSKTTMTNFSGGSRHSLPSEPESID